MCGRSNSLSEASIRIIQAINEARTAREAEVAEGKAQAVAMGGDKDKPELFAASDAASKTALAVAAAIDDILLAEISADTSAGRRYVEARVAHEATDAEFDRLVEAEQAKAQAMFEQLFGDLRGEVEKPVLQ